MGRYSSGERSASFFLLAAPASAPATETLGDGGFEGASCTVVSGTTTCTSPVWSQAKSYVGGLTFNPPTPICSTGNGDCTSGGFGPRNGTKWFRGGGFCTTSMGSFTHSASVSQDLIVPTGTATLSFYVRHTDQLGTSQLAVSFDGTSVYSSTGVTNAYQPVIVNASAIANGASHTFRIAYTGSGTSDGFGCTDSWEVDDLSLDVTASPPPPPPANAPASPPDATAPQTTIGKAKISQARRKATFKFSSSEVRSTFKCKLDKKPFKRCTSPRSYKKLKPGKHRFRARAIDKAGNADSTPAVKKFKIKR